MLVIRDAQMQIFVAQFLEKFENARVKDIAERFPTRFAALQETGVRRLIQAGIRKAREYDIRAEDDVETFIDLMVWHGAGFDEDAELAFETEPLRDATLPPDARVSLTMARMGLKPGFRE